jgi:hypothetical protein
MVSASELETNLHECVGPSTAAVRLLIAQTATLASRLSSLDAEIREGGADEDMAALHRELLTALGNVLHRLGPDKICMSICVSVLAQGHGTAQAIFRILPPVGCA